jgi:hypothetical protein
MRSPADSDLTTTEQVGEPLASLQLPQLPSDMNAESRARLEASVASVYGDGPNSLTSLLDAGTLGSGGVLPPVPPVAPLPAPSGVFDVYVEQGLRSAIDTSLTTYVQDLTAEGYQVRVTEFSGTAAELRGELQERWATASLEGALFVGDLPELRFTSSDSFSGASQVEYPHDLYFMDLDGTYVLNSTGLDQHVAGSGDVAPEIYVSRITTSELSSLSAKSEAELINQYFDKVHAVRMGDLSYEDRAVWFADDDWAIFTDYTTLSPLYLDVTEIDGLDETTVANYRSLIQQNAETFVQQIHSWPSGLSISGIGNGIISSSDVAALNPQPGFMNLFNCSAADFTSPSNLAAAYAYLSDGVVNTIGSAKTGSMLNFAQFYSPQAAGASVGQAFLQWFQSNAAPTNDQSLDYAVDWFYGMTMQGDPTLVPASISPSVESNQKIAFAELRLAINGQPINTPAPAASNEIDPSWITTKNQTQYRQLVALVDTDNDPGTGEAAFSGYDTAFNLSDRSTNNAVTSLAADNVPPDPVLITAAGKASNQSVGDLTGGVVYDPLRGFSLDSGPDQAAMARRLNNGDSLTFHSTQGDLSKASFVVATHDPTWTQWTGLPGTQSSIALDVDGDTIINPTGSSLGFQDDSLILLSGITDGQRVDIDFEAQTLHVGDVAQAVDAVFWQTFETAGGDTLTIGAPLGESSGYSIQDLVMTTGGEDDSSDALPDLDFAVTNDFGGIASVRFNDGAAAFSGTGSISVSDSPNSIELGDVDGDGDLDMVTTGSVRLNDGLGNFSSTGSITLGNNANSVALGDLDGDRDLDLVAAHQSSTGIATLGDLDSDGTMPIVTASGLPNLGPLVPYAAEYDYLV